MAKLRAPRRPARLTWVNFYDPWANSLATGVTQALDVLGSAEVFQKFDSTIVKVLGSLSYQFGQVPVGTSTIDFGVAAYLYVADEAIAAANLPDLTDPTVQAAYLWTYIREARLVRVVDGSLVDTADPSINVTIELSVDAQRRFRENNKTLWLVIQNIGVGTFLWGAYLRSLVRIP